MNNRRHPPILVLGYSEAAMFLRTATEPLAALVSIHGPHEFGVDAAVPLRLDLTFDDVANPDHLDPIARLQEQVRQRAQRENGRHLTPPTLDDAYRIIQFAIQTANATGTILFHCGAGVSRAPAAALLCLAAWTSPGDEPACLRHLRAIRPCASPHPDLIRFGDTLLKRNGKLIAALQPSDS